MIGRLLRTLAHLKPEQVWFQAWRRIQKKLERHPPCGNNRLPPFTFLNVTASPNGWNDTSLELLWRYNLHYFDYLNSPQPATNDSLILRWIAENPKGSYPGWDPYPTSLRIVNWIKWLISQPATPNSRPAPLLRSLRDQAGWLVSHLEYHLLANHLLANAKALVFAGAYLEDEKLLRKGLSIYQRELPRQTCADGVNFERSPMYHCIILEDLLDCIWLFRKMPSFSGLQPTARCPQLFSDYAKRMLDALQLIVGPDGKIAKFNDATEGIAKPPAQLLAYAQTCLPFNPQPAAHNPQPAASPSGYLRLSAGDYTLLAKCGEIGPSYQPGHAHADTYSFELWAGARKIVGDTGCSTYVPGPVRSYERSTAAHNTVVVDGENSSEVWASHRVGRRFDFGRHRRKFELTDKGLAGVDELNGRGEHEIDVLFHLPPGVPADAVAIECAGERIVEPCDFADGWNRRRAGTCIRFRQRTRLPVRLTWRLRLSNASDASELTP